MYRLKRANRLAFCAVWFGLLQRIAGAAAIAGIGYLAYADAWPFDEPDRRAGANPSVWELLLSDGITLGFARLLIAAFALYLVASVAALLVAGRWLRGFGTTGMSIDAAKDATKTLGAYEQELAQQRERLGERDRAIRELGEELASAEAALEVALSQQPERKSGGRTQT